MTRRLLDFVFKASLMLTLILGLWTLGTSLLLLMGVKDASAVAFGASFTGLWFLGLLGYGRRRNRQAREARPVKETYMPPEGVEVPGWITTSAQSYVDAAKDEGAAYRALPTKPEDPR